MAKEVNDLIIFLDGLIPLIRETAEASMKDNEDNIATLNRTQLQQGGIDANGQSLGEYTPFSKMLRAEKGLQTDFVDLRDTGKLQGSLDVKQIKELSFELLPTDPKWENTDLKDRYPNAWGLIDRNEEVLTKLIIRDLEFQVNSALL